jgi:hypothetical protein
MSRSLLLNSPIGHRHFWKRAALSRRQFLTAGAATTAGAVAATQLGGVGTAFGHDSGGTPRPIPGGIDIGDGTIIHTFLPGEGNEPSVLTDFKGFVAVGEGVGTGRDETGATRSFAVDNRFLAGRFIGTDGDEHEGTFGFF